MAHPSKTKGDRAELEVQALLRDHLGVPARRALGAGRRDDIGDVTGVPDTVIQVANYTDLLRAIREKLPESERQQATAGATFGATFVRRRGGQYVVVQTVEQWCAMWREAQPDRKGGSMTNASDTTDPTPLAKGSHAAQQRAYEALDGAHDAEWWEYDDD